MPRPRIVWSPTSIAHFSNWIRFIAKDSVRAAERERQELLRAVARLKRFPVSGRVVPEFGNPALREVIHKPLRIIYRLKGNQVRLMAFHHSKRELDLEIFS